MNFKNLFVALIVAISLSTAVVAQEAQDPNAFGDVKFGFTKEEVKASEKDSTLVLDHNEELMFNETSEFLGKSQNCYSFSDDGKLVAVTLNIINDHEDIAKYIEDYNKINEAFMQMYGEADEQGVSTDDEAILKDPAKLAQAIKDGKVVASTVWKKENYSISHILSAKMDSEGMDETTLKATVFTPICHLVLAQHNSIAASAEGEEAAK
ncbi:MAG: hypothetical protein IKO19_09745 [Candidatus Riflebacteria bacterium]|nr:hypothetical protein [Candidatus Riflebacteria bacterium]